MIAYIICFLQQTFSECFNYRVDIIDYRKNRKYAKEGTVLSTECETIDKKENAVVVLNESREKVGKIPNGISKICTDFLESNGTIKCKVVQKPEKKRATMSKDHYQVQCIYVFSASDKKLLEDVSEALKYSDVKKAIQA